MKPLSKKMKKILPLLLTTVALAACSTNATTSSSTSTSSSSQTSQTSTATTYFSDRDQDPSYDAEKATKISLTGSSATATGQGVAVSGSTVTITKAGTYVLSGSSENVQIIVKAGDQDKVQLVLDGVTMKGTDAAIVVENADKTFLTLAEGSSNSISDSSSPTNTDYDAAIYSKDDLTLNGSGSLTVEGNYGNAIESNDDLRITGGTYTIKAAKHGLSVNDVLNIKDASLTITATEDAVHADNDEDTSLGNLYIQSGILNIQAGDDGLHASNAALIDGGKITVSSSYEALEGKTVTINGGELDLTASDDGINAADPTVGETVPGQASQGVYIKITGGKIKVTVGQGDTDALDSNGDLYISGGELDITAQSAFDYDGQAEYTGGSLVVNGQTQTSITQTGPGSQGGRPGFGGPGGRP